MPNNKKLNKIFRYCLLFTCTCLFFACSSQKRITKENFIYFQYGRDSIQNIQVKEPVIQNFDLLSIQVLSASLNQEQTVPFNPPLTGPNSGYLVSPAGNVEMPVIGSIKAAGLTQVQLQNAIAVKLAPYVKDPAVIIHFLKFKLNILGEVGSPGTKTFEADRVTFIDALSAAGGITDYGKRDDILVLREEGKTRKMYKVNMLSGSVFQSPVYLLQSNDIIYVSASDQKFKALKAATASNARKALDVFGLIIGLFTSVVFAINVFK
ncbi:MAG: polysaccharide export protein [Ferruginibacter sp.]|nr:polysaccharide export protein [Ferruginibacter sp.]